MIPRSRSNHWKAVFLALAIMATLLVLTACGGNQRTIVGTWKPLGSGNEITFDKDGGFSWAVAGDGCYGWYRFISNTRILLDGQIGCASNVYVISEMTNDLFTWIDEWHRTSTFERVELEHPQTGSPKTSADEGKDVSAFGKKIPNGTWQGQVDQPGSPAYSVQIMLEDCGKKQPCGTVVYPELSCGGTWTLLWASGNKYIFRETLSFGKNRCVDNVVVHLTSEPGNKWSYYELEGRSEALLVPAE